VDIVGVCAAFNYLNPKKVYCNEPMLGKGFVQTEHGKLSVPPPAVIELVRQKNIKVLSGFDSIEGELSTPTGIALLSNLVDYLQPPSKYSVNSYGVGIGNLKFPFPNLVRVYKITHMRIHLLINKLIQSVKRYLCKRHGLMTKHLKIYAIL